MKLYKLALVASLLAPSVAFAQSGSGGLDTRAMDGAQRYAEINIPYIMTSSGSSNTVFGATLAPLGGVVYSRSGALANVFIPVGATTISTTTVAALPYAANVAVYHHLASSSGSACSQIIIQGVDQFGNDRSENLGAVSSSFVSSNYAYDRITGIFGTGCTYSGASTAAKLRMIVGRNLGLRRVVRNHQDILAYCFDSDGAATSYPPRCVNAKPYTGVVASNATRGDFEWMGLTLNTAYNTLTIPGTVGSAVSAGTYLSNGIHGSSVIIRLRGNKW